MIFCTTQHKILTNDRDWFSGKSEPTTDTHILASTSGRPQTNHVLQTKKTNQEDLLNRETNKNFLDTWDEFLYYIFVNDSQKVLADRWYHSYMMYSFIYDQDNVKITSQRFVRSVTKLEITNLQNETNRIMSRLYTKLTKKLAECMVSFSFLRYLLLFLLCSPWYRHCAEILFVIAVFYHKTFLYFACCTFLLCC